MKLNLPNKLTVLRLLLVPVILAFTILPYSIWANLAAFAVFAIASLTDLLDGKIARKYNLITDFGKFLDPLADKFMVIAAVFGLVCRGFVQQDEWLFWVFMVMLIVTIFRELRQGKTLDGQVKIKPTSGVLSAAEAISLMVNSMAISGSFGSGEVTDSELAAALQGAIVKDDDKDKAAWTEYLENVMRKKGRDYSALYAECKERNQ